MKISVVTPSIREAELDLNYQSLKNQTFKDFEWIICSPFIPVYTSAIIPPFKVIYVPEPPKEFGDFMGENKAYNELFKVATGELIVTLNDAIYLAPNALEKFWEYFQKDPMSCVAFIGNHYRKIVGSKGINLTYRDVREDQIFTKFQECGIVNFDACCSSIPAVAVKRAGPIDPVWDKYCCFGIRELMWKVVEQGYKLYLSRESYYMGQKHTKDYDPDDLWTKKFNEGGELFRKKYGALH